MTKRLIVLELDESTTATDCGGCRYVQQPAGGGGWGGPPFCAAHGGPLYTSERLPECLAAEKRSARLVEIDPKDAATFTGRLGLRRGPDSESALKAAAVRRIREVLREHGRNA